MRPYDVNYHVVKRVDYFIATAIRYGGHIFAALWIAYPSWQAGGFTRIMGLPFAVILGGYSLSRR